MAVKKDLKHLDITTESKIKAAARTVFHKKGYAATRTRDIAEEAGINLALLNYYFRSKEKLFEIIMLETLSGFIKSVSAVFNDESTGLETKIEHITARYIDLISLEPEIPLFIASEIRNKPDSFLEKLPIRQMILDSVLFKQYAQGVTEGRINESNPLHFLLNLIGLVVFPFIAKPLITRIGDLNDQQFNQLMQERKKRIPTWLKAAFGA